MDSAMWIVAGVLFAAFLIMIPVQYRYIEAIKEDPRREGLDQETYYKNMSFQEEQLHYSMEGWFWPSAMIVAWIYRVKHRKKNKRNGYASTRALTTTY